METPAKRLVVPILLCEKSQRELLFSLLSEILTSSMIFFVVVFVVWGLLGHLLGKWLFFLSLHLDAGFLGMCLEGDSEKCLLPGSGVVAWNCKVNSTEL